MKTLLSLFTVLFLGLQAQAKPVLGSKCGLVDRADSELLIYAKKAKDLSSKAALTDLEKQQVVITANTFIAPEVGEMMDSATVAREALISYSEDGVSYISEFKVDGKATVYTEVSFFPSHEPEGAIFVKGTRTIVAYIKGDRIICK